MLTEIEMYLMDMAGADTPADAPHLAAAGDLTGVAMPDGRMLTAEAARRLGARLIRAAELHDRIYMAGYAHCESAVRRANLRRMEEGSA